MYTCITVCMLLSLAANGLPRPQHVALTEAKWQRSGERSVNPAASYETRATKPAALKDKVVTSLWTKGLQNAHVALTEAEWQRNDARSVNPIASYETRATKPAALKDNL